MKTTILLSSIVLAFLLTGCMQTRFITEKYIKTNIEIHKEGQFSTIKTYSIFKGISIGGGKYLELTGYKYANQKALVIGADSYCIEKPNYKGDHSIIADIAYIELNLEQCKNLMDNYKVMLDKIKDEKPGNNEEVYYDYTVSDDLFISFRKISTSNPTYIDFWIKGEKFTISTTTIMKKFDKFMNY